MTFMAIVHSRPCTSSPNNFGHTDRSYYVASEGLLDHFEQVISKPPGEAEGGVEGTGMTEGIMGEMHLVTVRIEGTLGPVLDIMRMPQVDEEGVMIVGLPIIAFHHPDPINHP